MMLPRVFNSKAFWQMTPGEKAIFLHIVDQIQENWFKTPRNDGEPLVAIEVGSYCGGTLQHLAENFDIVYSLDLSHDRLYAVEENVVCIPGDSRETLPKLIQEFNENKVDCALIHIDGNHEYEYVASDLKAALQYNPLSETIILMHDSFYPPTRQAISACRELHCPKVHKIDLDFCVGYIMPNGTPISGFAYIEMSSQNKGPAKIEQEYNETFWRLYNK